MKNLNTLFDLLTDWRQLPAYQFGTPGRYLLCPLSGGSAHLLRLLRREGSADGHPGVPGQAGAHEPLGSDRLHGRFG